MTPLGEMAGALERRGVNPSSRQTTASRLDTQTSGLRIQINGQRLQPHVFNNILDVTIDQDLVLPDAFVIRLHDIEDSGTGTQTPFTTANGDLFRVGQEVEIGLGREEEARSTLKGEITSIDLEARADGVPLLTVRGYDKAHRLHRVKKTRTFENKTFSDIVKQVARDNGLTAQADSTSVVYEYLAQDGQTDWELVRTLARQSGYEAFASGNRLHFRKPDGSQSAPDQDFGVTLRQVRLRMSAASQVNEVEVRGWDPKNKQAVVGTASLPGSTTGTDRGDHGGQVAEKAFGAPGKYILSNHTVRTQQEATSLAQAVLDEIAGCFIQLDCVCLGDHNLLPGRSVKLGGLGTRFSKEYYISAASHRLGPRHGYMTHITVSGRQPTSLSTLLTSNGQGGGPGAPAAARPVAGHPGVVVGVVSNNKDSQMGGRIKVKFPWFGETIESAWARVATPLAGNGRGLYWLPEVNDEVLLAFEHGDVNHPYVVGYLWNGKDTVPKQADQVVGNDGKVNQRIIKTTSGHTITLDDSAETPSITIVDKTEQNKIHVDSKANKITITVDRDMDLLATNGNINLKGKTINVEATNDLKIRGMSVSTEATQALKMKGAQTEVEGTSTMKVSGASTDVKASAKLGLDGGGITEVKGGLIRLN